LSGAKSYYQEIDRTNPLNVYGQSKLAGEEAIQGGTAIATSSSTSWVHSTRQSNSKPCSLEASARNPRRR